eukprot:4937850-Amphidinium_carterae.1
MFEPVEEPIGRHLVGLASRSKHHPSRSQQSLLVPAALAWTRKGSFLHGTCWEPLHTTTEGVPTMGANSGARVSLLCVWPAREDFDSPA